MKLCTDIYCRFPGVRTLPHQVQLSILRDRVEITAAGSKVKALIAHQPPTIYLSSSSATWLRGLRWERYIGGGIPGVRSLGRYFVKVICM
jgi:hypothetical protein